MEGAQSAGFGAQAHFALTVEQAKAALDAFEASAWGRKYPAIVRSCVPPGNGSSFAFSEPTRRAVYTANTIESLNSTVLRAARTGGTFRITGRRAN